MTLQELIDSLPPNYLARSEYEAIRARLAPDRERVIEAVREAYLSATNATDGMMLSEDYAVVADAAIAAMGETP